MAKPNSIELPGCEPIPILYEDRSVLAVDKPPGWMLVPVSWQKTARNLQAALNFRILDHNGQFALVEARPVTGRTHQIRVHLAEAGLPIVDDDLYGGERVKKPGSSRRKEAPILIKSEPRHLGCYEAAKGHPGKLGLRAVRLAYADPFTRRHVEIRARRKNFAANSASTC
jgi:23S rRNA-/tRNA-specific pseudouridylate synthase